jgi:predicted amidohydrolase YtcJ
MSYKLADVVVLDDHILTCPPERLRSIRPDLTVIGGRVAIERSAAR